IVGMGMNWQNCRNMDIVGLSDRFEQVFQAIRRCSMFGQSREVNVYIVISEEEGAVFQNIRRKEKEFELKVVVMVATNKKTNKDEINSTQKNVMSYGANEEMKLPTFI